jgi:hypothetical protein
MNEPVTIKRTTFNYRWYSRKMTTSGTLMLIIGITVLVAGYGFWRSTLCLGIGSFILFLAFTCFVEQEVSIDPDSKVMYRKRNLFGQICIGLKKWPLSDFTSVKCSRDVDAFGEGDLVFIGLRRKAGRTVRIKYFNVPSGRSAAHVENEARVLADAVGMPLEIN